MISFLPETELDLEWGFFLSLFLVLGPSASEQATCPRNQDKGFCLERSSSVWNDQHDD